MGDKLREIRLFLRKPIVGLHAKHISRNKWSAFVKSAHRVIF